jgi:hypothetical protein
MIKHLNLHAEYTTPTTNKNVKKVFMFKSGLGSQTPDVSALK